MELHASLREMLALAALTVTPGGWACHNEAAYGQKRDEYTLLLPLQGNGLVRLTSEEYTLLPDEALLLAPGCAYDLLLTPPAACLCIPFAVTVADVLDALAPFAFPAKAALSQADAAKNVDRLTTKNTLLGLASGLEQQLAAQSLVLPVLAAALDAQSTQDGLKPYQPFIDMVPKLKQNCAAHDAVQALAQGYDLHPTYLSNRFAEVYGISPMVLQKAFRVQRAREMLAAGKSSVTQVAQALGYESANNFSRFFKEETGWSPLQYKNRYRTE